MADKNDITMIRISKAYLRKLKKLGDDDKRSATKMIEVLIDRAIK